MKSKLKLLVIAPRCDTFIKEQINVIANDSTINKVTLLVHHNHLSEIAKYLPWEGYLSHVRRFTKENLIGNWDDKPENVKTHIISMPYFIPDMKNWRLGDKVFKKFDKFIQNEKIEFDLIHAHFTWPSGYVGLKLSKKFNVPIVITIHENRDWFIEEYNSKNKKIYWTWRNADALIRVNKKDITLLKEFNDNVFFVANGFNPKKFFVMEHTNACKILGLPHGKRIVFSFGNLIERKGFHYLIDAINDVAKFRKDVLCIIGGEGFMKRKLEKKIQKLGLNDYVKLIGFVPDDKIVYWLNAADMFAFPSLAESFGLVVIEALATGLPVVATYNGGSEEIITSEAYGFLVEPASTKELTEKIFISLDKEWDSEKILEYAGRFRWEYIVEEILKVYEGVLK